MVHRCQSAFQAFAGTALHAAFEIDDSVGNGGLRRHVHAGVERRVDSETGGDDFLLGHLVLELADQLGLDEVGEEGGLVRTRDRRGEPDRHVQSCRCFRFRDLPRLDHLPQNDSLALLRSFPVAVGGIVARAADQARHHRYFRQIQLVQALAEEVLSAFGDAVHFQVTDLAEVDFIQIALKDALLVEARFEDEGQEQLVGLAEEILSAASHEVLDELLSDGASALGERLGAQIDPYGANQPPWVETSVIEEVLVFDGDNGLPDWGGDLVKSQDVTDLSASFGASARQCRDQLRLEVDLGKLLRGMLQGLKLRVFSGPVELELDRLARRGGCWMIVGDQVGRVFDGVKPERDGVFLCFKRVAEGFES